MSYQEEETGKKTVVSRAIFLIGIGVSLLHLYFNLFTVLPTLWQNSLHYSGFALLCGLVYPFSGGTLDSRTTAGLIFDLTVGIIAAVAAIYMISLEDAIYSRGVHLSPAEWVAGIILILTAIEFTRRTTGWIIPVIGYGFP